MAGTPAAGAALRLAPAVVPEQIDWTDDGQRCQPQLSARLAFFQATRDWLEQHKQPLQIIQGDWDERRVQAFEAVARLWLIDLANSLFRAKVSIPETPPARKAAVSMAFIILSGHLFRQ
jgi:hypothetical protein